MIRHKRLTFRAGSFGRFIQKHSLSMTWVQTTAIPFWMPRDSSLFVVSLSREGHPLRFAFFHYSKPPEDPGPPELEEVLAFLAYDALDYENVGGDIERWGDIQGGIRADDRDAQMVFASVERDAQALQGVLGNEGYMELLEIARSEFY